MRQGTFSQRYLKTRKSVKRIFYLVLLMIATLGAHEPQHAPPIDVELKAQYGFTTGTAGDLDYLGIGTARKQLQDIVDRAMPNNCIQVKSRIYCEQPTAQASRPIRILTPKDGIKKATDKTIYGSDDSRHFYAIPNQQAKDKARGVASISKYSERFVHARSVCTAFLIAKDKAMTAAHCVNGEDYRMLVIRFNDQFRGEGFLDNIDAYEIEAVDAWDQSHDFAVVRVKKNSSGQYPGEKYPVLQLRRKPADLRTPLYMIGHPGRDYKKYVDNCSVVTNLYFHPRGKHTVGVDCDAFGGNSGSPVFHANSHMVVGVFWGGQHEDRLIPVADQTNHEFVVPMWKIAEVRSFDVGEWPPDVSFVGLLNTGLTTVAPGALPLPSGKQALKFSTERGQRGKHRGEAAQKGVSEKVLTRNVGSLRQFGAQQGLWSQ